eukprot:512217-Prorocentrum_minimum.AAC.2
MGSGPPLVHLIRLRARSLAWTDVACWWRAAGGRLGGSRGSAGGQQWVGGQQGVSRGSGAHLLDPLEHVLRVLHFLRGPRGRLPQEPGHRHLRPEGAREVALQRVRRARGQQADVSSGSALGHVLPHQLAQPLQLRRRLLQELVGGAPVGGG